MSDPQLDRSPARPVVPEDWLSAHAALPGAQRVLDPAALTVLLGREVEIDRVRIKPGASVLVSHRAVAAGGADDSRGRDLAHVGWAQLVASRDKRDGVLRRADRGGIEVTEHAVPGQETDGPFLLSGGADSDPRLGRAVQGVLRRLPDGPAPRVLSYNPGRHLLLELPGSGEVLRVAVRSLEDQLGISREWERRGVPTVPQRTWKHRSSVLIGQRWGRGDLAARATDPHAGQAAAALGHAIGRLHTGGAEASAPSTGVLPRARLGDRIPSATDVLCDLLPQRTEQVQELIASLDQLLPAPGAEAWQEALIHGDLSPDQVLLGSTASQIRVVDLDRSGAGPRGADLGSWIAACLSEESDHLTGPFLRAYAEHVPLPAPAELAAWTARALLGAALDPMRRQHPDWPARIQQRLDLTRTLLGAATEEQLPALGRALADHPGATVVSHREGRRAVLRDRTEDGTTVYIKVANRGRTRRALGAIQRAAAFDGPFRTPRVIEVREESLTFAELPGRPLHDGLPTADGSWRRAWRATAEAWAQAVRTSRADLPEGPLHGPAEEIAVLQKWQQRAIGEDPEAAELRDRAVDLARGLLEQLPPLAQPALIHRDLHDKQILWDPALGPGLLDVDTACLGDPALDAANLRAHATWRKRQGTWSPEQARQVREEIDRATAALDLPAANLAAYETATLARLTCLYALRPRWRQAAAGMARSLLARGRLGVPSPRAALSGPAPGGPELSR